MDTSQSSVLSAPKSWSDKIKEKLISAALSDPIFQTGLEDAAEEISTAGKAAPNEATIETIFEQVLYATLKVIGISFHPIKEAFVDTRRHTGKGRTDSRLGALVIEYKHRAKLVTPGDIESAFSQLEDYLVSISSEIETDVCGFLTDGIHIYELRALNGKVISRSGRQLVTAHTLFRLTRNILSLEQSALTARNLVHDFCGAGFGGVLFDVARKLNDIIATRSTSKTEMLFSEWEELFRLAHQDQSQQRRIQERRKILGYIYKMVIDDANKEYRALFALHTAYAILLKLIAYRIVSDIRFGTVLQDYKSLLGAESDVIRVFCQSLEDGGLFRQLGMLNLLEGDFFSWYTDKDQWNGEMAAVINEILQILSRYEDVKSIFESKSVVDLFRTLYEATVPQVIRASFGEFYTPYWLADHVLETSVLKRNWSVLDPCCGSGTFVIAAIARIREELDGEEPATICEEVLRRVAAIDLNPLGVLTTRIHYFIHVADLLPKHIDNLVIPVFLGDASYVPTVVEEDDVKFLAYELRTLKTPIAFRLPLDLARDTSTFVRTMLEYEELIRNKDEKAATKRLLRDIPHIAKKVVVKKEILELSTQLVKLEQKGWNGIWARIITNFLSTACLPKFTNIVGNPPWIDWKNLPAGYRDKVKALCIDKGLFSGAGRTGGINLNIWALIAHVSATNWLGNGHLAFLMPRELANQPSYEGWRVSVGGTGCRFKEFHDWSAAGHPFDPVKGHFMTYVIEAKSGSQTIVPLKTYRKRSRKRPGATEWQSIEEALEHLDVQDRVAGQVIEGSTAYTFADDLEQLRKFARIAGRAEYIGREGIEFYPQELMLFGYDGPGPKKGTVFVKNYQAAKSKYRIPQQRVLLETKYLYPLVKGPHIEHFQYNDPDIIVPFPYDKKDPHRPIDQKTLKNECPLLLGYFKKYEKLIRQQTGYSDTLRVDGEFYGVARTGPYSFRNVYVGFRDNTKWRAVAVTQKKMPWGSKKRYLFQNHAVSICETEARDRYITIDESYYICGILNTKIVEEFIYASSDTRSFKIRPPVYIPMFDASSKEHAGIAKLSRECHEGKKDIALGRKLIEKIYLKICRGNPHAVKIKE